MTETAVETASSPRRGRPRPQSTIDRDETTLMKLREAGDGGLTRETLAEQLPDVASSLTYLSLFRLRRDGKITRTQVEGKHVWAAIRT